MNSTTTSESLGRGERSPGEHEVEWKTSIKYCQGHPMWSKFGSAHAQYWWIQGSKKKTDGERGAFEAALCQ